MKCEYCGNNSGKQDSKGMCVSCGAPLKKDFMWLEDYSTNNHSTFTPISSTSTINIRYSIKEIDERNIQIW